MFAGVRTRAFILAALILLVDQWTKTWALSHLASGGERLVLPGPVDLTLSLNHSNAFGLTPVIGGLTRWGLTALNLAVAGLILFHLLTRRFHGVTTFGLVLIMVGAVCNAVDRARLGAVIDFIDATKIGFPWIFNVADATLDVGIGLLGLSVFLHRQATGRDMSGET